MRVSIVRRQRDDGQGMEAQTVKLTADRPEDIPFLHELILDAEKHNEDLAPDGGSKLPASREYEAARGNSTAQYDGGPLTPDEVRKIRGFIERWEERQRFNQAAWDAHNDPLQSSDAPQQS